MQLIDKIESSVDFILSQILNMPEIGIILGSGLGNFAHNILFEKEINYSEIPNFPVSTVESHSGKLIFGKLGEKNVVAMQGRFHYYEDYSMEQVTFPIRVMKMLGVKTLIVSNAAGGLNPDFRTGDLMIINDHINFFPEHPLRGKNFEQFGQRFPNMNNIYDRELIELAKKIAFQKQILLKEGVYIGSQGPSLETAAEYRMFRLFGADATGMSTVPEIIVARHSNIRCFGISVITNESEKPSASDVLMHKEVNENAASVEPILANLLIEMIRQM